MKEQINFEQFLNIEKQLDIRIGGIVSAERVPKSKLLKLTVDFGTETRTVATNIGDGMTDEEIQEKIIGYAAPFIMNLEPAIMKGVESTAMIMVPTIDGVISLGEVALGAKLM